MFTISSKLLSGSKALRKACGLLVALSIPVFGAAKAQEVSQKPAAAEPGTPACLQIVNATCVPKVSVSVDGVLRYPELAQGLWTGFGPSKDLAVRYTVVDLASGKKVESEVIKLEPHADQTLVITGDFSTDVPPGNLAQSESLAAKPEKPRAPNVQFQLYSHSMSPDEKGLRFRFINAMPGISLTIKTSSNPPKAIAPGDNLVLAGQPKKAHYEIAIGEMKIPVTLVRKDKLNQTVVFYLKDGAPAYVAISEEKRTQ